MSDPSGWSLPEHPLAPERPHGAMSTRLLEAMFEQASDAILLADDDGRYIDANPAACRLTGYDRDELLEMCVDDLAPPEARSLVPEAWRAFRQAVREEGEFTLLRKDGRLVETEYRAVADIRPGVHLSILTDVTERRRVVDELRASEERYRRFFDEDLTGDCVATPEGRILECNEAFATIFGFESVEAARSAQLAALFPDRQIRRRFLREMRSKGRVDRYETEGRTIAGETVYLVANIVGSFDERGELVEMRGYVFDDTDRRRTEQQLLQAQKMEGIGRLAGGVAHDFNNLITAIAGYSDLCLAALPEGTALRGYLEEIKRAGERGAALARQLLAFSRMQVLKPKVLDLNAIVAETESLLQRLIGEDIRLTTNLAPDLPPVKADPGQIAQVIVNLAVNARDAMPQGGELAIETGRVELTAASAERYEFTPHPGRYVRVSVRDTGAGMTDEVRDHVFEPFFTTKEPGQGTGLGLSTAYGIVKQSGGYIAVESAPGAGACFEILLPEAEPEEEGTLRRGAEHGPSRGRETILVVEDEEPLRRLLAQILLRSGYTVVEAMGGSEALEACRKLACTLDLVITDVVMPDMGGPALATELALHCPDTKVLFISGYPGDTIVRRGDLSQDRPFLQKPFDQATLLTTVRNVLDGTP